MLPPSNMQRPPLITHHPHHRFGTLMHGLDEHATPLSEEEQLLITTRLHQVLCPFMLRRLKQHVLGDTLPRKVGFGVQNVDLVVCDHRGPVPIADTHSHNTHNRALPQHSLSMCYTAPCLLTNNTCAPSCTNACSAPPHWTPSPPLLLLIATLRSPSHVHVLAPPLQIPNNTQQQQQHRQARQYLSTMQ